MEQLHSEFSKVYSRFFSFIAKDRIKSRDMDLRQIHFHIGMVACTSILMWAYSILCYIYVSHPAPFTVGFICSAIHLFSPLLYRYSNRGFLICNIAIGMGLLFQTTFSYYTGGFMSYGVMWFPVLPMLAGIISGIRGAVIWAITAVALTLYFFISHLSGMIFPNFLDPKGYIYGLALLRFGWIYLITSMILLHLAVKQTSEDTLLEHSKKVDDLFRVLFHDLANSIGRISIGTSIAQRGHLSEKSNRGLEIVNEATASMFDITRNVRRMYAVSKGKAEMEIIPTSLNETIDYLKKIFAEELEKKKLKVDYDFEKHDGLSLLVEPISFKNQVLGNIISNAIKFSHPQSSIKIQAYPVNSTFCAVEIKDDGIGMPDILIQQIFDLTKKTNRPGTNGESGTGFGMHIMKSFMELYEGEVKVTSIESTGTTFRLILKGQWQ